MKSIPKKPAPSKSSATPLSLSRFLTLWHQRGGKGYQTQPRKLFSAHHASPISRKISAVCSPRRGAE
jgi:hypothetical protein